MKSKSPRPSCSCCCMAAPLMVVLLRINVVGSASHAGYTTRRLAFPEEPFDTKEDGPFLEQICKRLGRRAAHRGTANRIGSRSASPSFLHFAAARGRFSIWRER